VGASFRAPQGPQIGREVGADDIASCLSLLPHEIATSHHKPIIASVGLPFAVAEVHTLESLGRAKPDPAAFSMARERYRPEDRFSLFVCARSSGDATKLRARMFAPLSKIYNSDHNRARGRNGPPQHDPRHGAQAQRFRSEDRRFRQMCPGHAWNYRPLTRDPLHQREQAAWQRHTSTSPPSGAQTTPPVDRHGQRHLFQCPINHSPRYSPSCIVHPASVLAKRP